MSLQKGTKKYAFCKLIFFQYIGTITMIFEFSQLTQFCDSLPIFETVTKGKKGNHFVNCASSFDIETTNTYINNEKCAFMYVWQFAINDNVIYGREWSEFQTLLNTLYDRLQLFDKILVIYVHNLAFEFQFLRKRFTWIEVFADSERKPLKAITNQNIEFRCSYRLSGYNLETVAKNLHDFKIKKLIGKLDYSKIRHSKTPLSNNELQYCFNDVLIVTAFIREKIKEFGNIAKIPLTQTAIVREYVREKCFDVKGYKYFIKSLTLDPTEYKMLKFCFQGGFTHANAMYSNRIMKNVTSFDFTSSYPTVMISEKYPMSKGKKVGVTTLAELDILVNKGYGFIVYVTFNNVKCKFRFENSLSLSKTIECKNHKTNNGRIVECDSFSSIFNEIDLQNFLNFYNFENVSLGACYVYEMDYLPNPIIESILKFYKDKTELKGVEGKESEYLHGKELLNSMYGMCVTDIVRDTYTLDKTNEWSSASANIENEIDIYNKNQNRFLFYPWGVWVTAYARRNLFSGIIECKNDYVYSDTDSIKILNAENHKKYFDEYNKTITTKIEKCLQYCNIDKTLARPKTIKGIEKPLGVWDFDGFYKRFKTLGAKRYLVEYDNNEISVTVAGWGKQKAKEFLTNQKNAFESFSDNLNVPIEYSGKLTHTYIDYEQNFDIVDYLGNLSHINELSSVHLENAPFSMRLSAVYLDYILELQSK